jgi:membrane associated rhomboid family serine protease
MAQGGIALATVIVAATTAGGIVYLLLRPRLVSLFLTLILALNWGVAAGSANRGTLVAWEQILFIPPHFWTGGDPQSILLSIFVHLSLFHLAFNCIGLYLFGLLLEEKHGARLVLGAFVLSGLAGNVAFAAVNASEFAVLLGASGGVLGVIGALARLSPYERITVFGIGVILPNLRMWVVALVFATIDLAMAVASEFANVSLIGAETRVAYVAHLSGLAAGLLLAPLLAKMKGPGKVARVAPTEIERIVPGDKGKEIAAALKGETDPEIIGAWMKRIEELAKCPDCGERMSTRSGGKFRCAKGHRRRIDR